MPIQSISYRGYVYLIGSFSHEWFKIGRTKNVSVRLADLGILLPFPIQEVAVWKTNDPAAAEFMMHGKYAKHRLNGEWFRFSPFLVAAIAKEDHSTDRIAMKLISEGDGVTMRKFSKQKLVEGQRKVLYEILKTRVAMLMEAGSTKTEAWKEARKLVISERM